MTGRRISTKTERQELLTALTDSEVRAVRDDRLKITDDLYRVLESHLDPLALRTALFAHMTLITTEAVDETVERQRAQMQAVADRVERDEHAALTREEADRWSAFQTPHAPSATAQTSST
ncbi:hypothetical protein [Microbacterium sp. NPDC089696]|uniref:hypothetical protein n=1 Tax=Microbacterium sp. NPDC089696 TaxID=3364199 RepID=UPI00380805ED